MVDFYNTHVHIFNGECVPPGFYGRDYRNVVNNMTLLVQMRKFLIWFAKILNPFNEYDKAHRLAKMVMSVSHESQEDVLEELFEAYSSFPTMKFVVLPIDFDFMNGGEPLLNYQSQLQELVQIKRKYPSQILPFVCVDPRRYQGEKLVEFVKSYIKIHEFAGIKMYPALGFFPFDPALFKLFEFAEKNDIPIITHCDPGGIYLQGEVLQRHLDPQHFADYFSNQESQSGIPDPTLIRIQNLPQSKRKFKKAAMNEFRKNFSNPNAFYDVLNAFPKLKICFAHFGGRDEIKKSFRSGSGYQASWFDEIKELMHLFGNVYADISYTLHDDSISSKLIDAITDTNYSKRILFGTDFFLVSREKEESKLVADFKGKLDAESKELFPLIASKNPAEFLRMNSPATL